MYMNEVVGIMSCVLGRLVCFHHNLTKFWFLLPFLLHRPLHRDARHRPSCTQGTSGNSLVSTLHGLPRAHTQTPTVSGVCLDVGFPFSCILLCSLGSGRRPLQDRFAGGAAPRKPGQAAARCALLPLAGAYRVSGVPPLLARTPVLTRRCLRFSEPVPRRRVAGRRSVRFRNGGYRLKAVSVHALPAAGGLPFSPPPRRVT